MTSQSSRPVILLVSLAKRPFFDEMYEPLIDRLAAKADLKRASNATAALNFLASKSPNVIILTDQGIAYEKHAEVLQIVQNYTRNGGRTIIATHFSSFIRRDKFDDFFLKWSVPWSHGEYNRSDVTLNQSCARRVGLQALPATYSVKALKIKNAETGDMLYSPSRDALTQSNVFAPGPTDSTQAAVVFASWGAGSLAYIEMSIPTLMMLLLRCAEYNSGYLWP